MNVNLFKRIKSYLSQGNRAVWCVFVLFASAVFAKGMIFHWSCFHSVLLSSIWYQPHEFVRFWGGKIVPALFLGSFVFISRNRLWTICVNVLADIWLIANMFYYKANALFLSYETMQMADNMAGFWDSLYSYTEWSMAFYPILTVLFVLALLVIPKPSHRMPIAFAVVLCVSLLNAVVDNVCYRMYSKEWAPNNDATNQVNKKLIAGDGFVYYYPFGHVYYYAVIECALDYNKWAECYVKDYSIYSYLPACVIYNCLAPAGEMIELASSDEERIQPFVTGCISDSVPRPRTNLIFILFESLESWTIDEVCGYQFMPNLSQMVHSPNALYCDKLKSQVKHGNSADGQMIDVTGILPISNGAACRLFKYNTFPSYAQCYPHSAIINPAVGLWNQTIMTNAYQFKQLIEPEKVSYVDDAILFAHIKDYIDTIPEPFCVLGITISSHVPFVIGSTNPRYTIEGMPAILSAYLNCLHYTDSLIGDFCKYVYGNERLASNTTIVISGDHTIFRSQDEQIDTYAKSHNIPMQTTQTFTPLLIYSPLIQYNTIQVTDTCYQMDIYPTIMSVIGCEDYFWKGLGVNLMDSVARNNRPITEQEAYELSDKIIRSNYFGSH